MLLQNRHHSLEGLVAYELAHVFRIANQDFKMLDIQLRLFSE